MAAVAQFFKNIASATYSLKDIADGIDKIYCEVVANPTMSSMWKGIMNFLKPHFAMYCVIISLFLIAVALFGKKMIGFLRFAFFAVVGFGIGTHYLASVIPAAVKIPGWLVGIVVAIVAAVLCRFLYFAMYGIAFGYGAYILSYNGFYITAFKFFTKDSVVISIIVSVIILAISLALRKYVEMAITAFLASRGAIYVMINGVYNFANWPIFDGKEWLGTLVFTILIGAATFVFQIRTRRRY